MAVYNDASPNNVVDQDLGGHKYVKAADSPQGVSSQLDINFEEWKRRALLRLAVEAGLDPSSDSDMLLAESIVALIDRERPGQNSLTDATSGRFLTAGAFGIGNTGNPLLIEPNATTTAAGIYTAIGSQSGAPPGFSSNEIFSVLVGRGYARLTQLWQSARYVNRLLFRRWDGNWTGYSEVFHTGNTTTDSNGNLRPASPVVRVGADESEAFSEAGAGVVNGEAEGVTIEHPGEGVYIVHGSLGFADDGWNIVTPQSNNGQELLWVSREVADSVITIHTYHRTHPDAPPFAQNNIDGYSNGDPIDIPEGRWIDLRLKMPEPEQPGDESESA